MLINYPLFLIMLLCSTPVSGQGAEQQPRNIGISWVGALGDGFPLTQETLDDLVAKHGEWLGTADEKKKKELDKGQLEEHYIEQLWQLLDSNWGVANGRLNLRGAKLRKANLERADLRAAKLEEADLIGANLEEAKLRWANLEGADLRESKLEEANLRWAKLEGADLRWANLEGTDLGWAKSLGSESYLGAFLKSARLDGVDLTEHRYEPKPGGVPAVESLVDTKNLETLRYEKAPHGLIELRRAFKDAGYREQERKITFALKRSEREIMTCLNQDDLDKKAQEKSEKDTCIARPVEAAFNFVFFEFPVEYGMSPGRALQILAGLIFLFAIPYTYRGMLGIHVNMRRTAYLHVLRAFLIYNITP